MSPKLCVSCGEVIVKKSTRPSKPGFSVLIFECKGCGKTERVVVDNRFI